MEFDADNDNGPFETLFNHFNGYNARLTLAEDRHHEFDVEIVGANRTHAQFKKWTDTDENEASGETIEVPFDDVAVLIIY